MRCRTRTERSAFSSTEIARNMWMDGGSRPNTTRTAAHDQPGALLEVHHPNPSTEARLPHLAFGDGQGTTNRLPPRVVVGPRREGAVRVPRPHGDPVLARLLGVLFAVDAATEEVAG